MLEPTAWPPLCAARQVATKCGLLTQGGKRRVVVLLHHRLLIYKENSSSDEKHSPHHSLSLVLCSLDLVDSELRVGPHRLRGEDRRDTLAWLLLLREAKHAVSRQLFFAGATHAAAEELPGSVTAFFEPLPALQLDLAWRPSLSERWWPDDAPDNLLLKEGRLRAASAAKLIERLLDETATTHNDVVCFLLTFESFLTPAELLDALASHFDRPQRGAEGFKMRPDQVRTFGCCNVYK
jgi:hypothetical protein